tara:strand:+ start:375 stop:716 length:342 start_codon:yes stop_codon:yes gene_type:complete
MELTNKHFEVMIIIFLIISIIILINGSNLPFKILTKNTIENLKIMPITLAPFGDIDNTTTTTTTTTTTAAPTTTTTDDSSELFDNTVFLVVLIIVGIVIIFVLIGIIYKYISK